jgi:hypothetical protein
VRGSDLTVRHGHISKQGSAWLRWVLNQAAQTAKRSPEFAPTYAAIAKRRGTKIATMAIARELLTRLPPARRPGSPATQCGGTPTSREGHQTRLSSLLRHEPASGQSPII